MPNLDPDEFIDPVDDSVMDRLNEIIDPVDDISIDSNAELAEIYDIDEDQVEKMLELMDEGLDADEASELI